MTGKQLEYAQDKEIRCYNKECSGNKENQCIVTDRICISRVAEPINYEEEYKKLKEENKKILIENAELKELKASYEDSMDTMNDLAIERKKQIEELEKEVEKAKNEENIKLDNSMTLLQSENDEYIEALEKVRTDNERLKNNQSGLVKENDNLRYQLREAKQHIKSITNREIANQLNIDEKKVAVWTVS